MIYQMNFRHGAALCAIADCPQFTAVNKASSKYGHYVLNHDRDLFLKYCSKRSDDYGYAFVVNGSDFAAMLGCHDRDRTFLVLTCGEEVVTALSLTELSAVVSLSAGDQWLRVMAKPNQSLYMRGPVGELGPIGRQDFPARLLP